MGLGITALTAVGRIINVAALKAPHGASICHPLKRRGQHVSQVLRPAKDEGNVGAQVLLNQQSRRVRLEHASEVQDYLSGSVHEPAIVICSELTQELHALGREAHSLMPVHRSSLHTSLVGFAAGSTFDIKLGKLLGLGSRLGESLLVQSNSA